MQEESSNNLCSRISLPHGESAGDVDKPACGDQQGNRRAKTREGE